MNEGQKRGWKTFVVLAQWGVGGIDTFTYRKPATPESIWTETKRVNFGVPLPRRSLKEILAFRTQSGS